MKLKFILVIALGAGIALFGCGTSSEESADSTPAAGDAAEHAQDMGEQAGDMAEHAQDMGEHAEAMASQTMEVQVGCGMCTYGMDGVKTCTAAAMWNDQPVLLTGVDVDAHGMGLCSEPKMAMVTGHLEDGKLVAEKVEFEE